ncbi:hypothetical protein LAHI110946_12730 [Lactococcus hircilactis]
MTDKLISLVNESGRGMMNLEDTKNETKRD